MKPGELLRAVRDAPGYQPPEKAVLLSMATYADPDGGSIRPGNVRLAENCGLTVRGLQKIQQRLQARGVLELATGSRGRGHAKLWRIRIASLERVNPFTFYR